jgi:tRNA (cytidine/uridine-2'-O-)-methyltransferase
LIEPQIPQNTGNISRTCAAAGLRLHLVRPLGFSVSDRRLKRAGLDYWKYLDVTYYENTRDFFDKNAGEYFYFTTKGQNIYSDIAYPDNAYLIFGREDKGLPEELLFAKPKSCVRIPMLEGARSLNLSNSVALAAYEVLRQRQFPGMKTAGELTEFAWPEP